MAAIASVNPATGDVLATLAPHSDDEVEQRVAMAAAAAPGWAATSVSGRARVLIAAAALLDGERESFGRLMSLEMGKTLRSGIDEAAKCALACRYFADHAERFLAPDTIPLDPPLRGEVRYLPLGAVLAVMPWNFPFWQVVRFAAPALVAGNVALLKHASNVPQCALALEDLFRRAGAPAGTFQVLLIGSERVAPLIGDPRIRAVTLTGSEPAGRAVAAAAGRHLKKAVLELGGSDPFIVLPGADVRRAAATAVAARIVNNGQSCIAAKRFILHCDVAPEFTERFVAAMSALVVGDPLDAGTDIGPLATAQLVTDLDAQVQETVSRGARVLLGAHRLDAPGNFYAPTVLADIPRGSPATEQELFGPVASLFTVADLDAAIATANDSTLGLAASVWTPDAAAAERCARELDCGGVFLNGMVVSDPRFPFGGVKCSGYGRELGVWGLREFVNVKTVRAFA